MSDDLKEIRILMLGESNVGKSSLILSLISEQYIDEQQNNSITFELPAKIESILIPPGVTIENVPVLITDYSMREQTLGSDLTIQIQRTNAICLVYAMNDESSKHKLATFWLPKINEILDNFKKPILIIGNKCDLSEREIIRDQFIRDLIKKHTEIETCIECSAKTFKNIPEIFYYAQKSVLYPTQPVYDTDKNELTSQCVQCLKRVFVLCDLNNDQQLDDDELNTFQAKYFNLNLDVHTLSEIKHLIRKKTIDGLANNNLTLNGFLYLNVLFIQKGRHETTWTILRKFGYDRSLTLKPAYLRPNLVVDENCTTELSPKGFDYLQYLFNKYDIDKKSYLTRDELNSLFSVCPVCPWGEDVFNTVKTNQTGDITFDGFLAQWVLTTYLDIDKAIELMAYLGYNNYYQESQLNAFLTTRSKHIDIRKNQNQRNCFLCYVYGKKKSGKSAFLQGLINRDLNHQTFNRIYNGKNSKWSCAAIPVLATHYTNKYLILKEINSVHDIDIHKTYPPDIVVLLYDITDPNSFEYTADIYLSIYNEKKSIPCFIIGTKYDQKSNIKQTYPIDANNFAKKYDLPPPQYFSASTAYLCNTDIYSKLIMLATIPRLYPMKNGLWNFFQNFSPTKALHSPNDTSTLTLFNRRGQLGLNSGTLVANNPLMRYSLLFALCLTSSFLVFKLTK